MSRDVGETVHCGKRFVRGWEPTRRFRRRFRLFSRPNLWCASSRRRPTSKKSELLFSSNSDVSLNRVANMSVLSLCCTLTCVLLSTSILIVLSQCIPGGLRSEFRSSLGSGSRFFARDGIGYGWRRMIKEHRLRESLLRRSHGFWIRQRFLSAVSTLRKETGDDDGVDPGPTQPIPRRSPTESSS